MISTTPSPTPAPATNAASQAWPEIFRTSGIDHCS